MVVVQRANTYVAIRQANPEDMASNGYLRRGAQLDPIRAALLVYLRPVRRGILGRGVQMYREGGTAHIKDVFNRVLVIRVVRIRLVALGLVGELAELARGRGRRVELCNRIAVVLLEKLSRTSPECRINHGI